MAAMTSGSVQRRVSRRATSTSHIDTRPAAATSQGARTGTPAQGPPDQPAPVVRRIAPSPSWRSLGLSELWTYRELVYFLTWRDLKVRYKQTILGATWAVVQPLLTMVIFTVVFDRIAEVSSEGLPYPLFSFAALVPWTFFATATQQSSQSVVSSTSLLTKVYFPRLAMPLAAAMPPLADMVLAGTFLGGMMVWYGVGTTIAIVWLPAFVLLALATALAVGLWLSALNVNYRDVRFVVPFLVQFWLYATPVAYSAAELDDPWRTLIGLNPMTGVVEGFRWSLLDTGRGPGIQTVLSVIVACVGLVSGAYYFRHMERSFADRI
jgi:lipopolysaccharide transport system permease protein